MTVPLPPEPIEDRIANRLSARAKVRPTSWPVGLLHGAGRLDRAVYRSVAGLSTPYLDRPLSRVSDFANHSKPWFLIAACLAVFGGKRGRHAALTGAAAIGVTSFVVNQPMKLAQRRSRPDRLQLGVPTSRWVSMPLSTSFPSGHSASAAAFAVSVGHVLPATRIPLRLAAATVAFSRVYTGVHYPGDVVVGATVGALIGLGISKVFRPRRRAAGHRRPGSGVEDGPDSAKKSRST